MTTLTPEQRIQAYEYAKERQQEIGIDYIANGVCHNLDDWYMIFKVTLTFNLSYLEAEFPEFFLQKPEILSGNGYWFSTRAERIAALDRAIELTKTKLP